jgi:hypothetical protein
MSDALTDTTEQHRNADAAAPGGADSGRHRGARSPADQSPAADPIGHGRHRRAEQFPANPGQSLA